MLWYHTWQLYHQSMESPLAGPYSSALEYGPATSLNHTDHYTEYSILSSGAKCKIGSILEALMRLNNMTIFCISWWGRTQILQYFSESEDKLGNILGKFNWMWMILCNVEYFSNFKSKTFDLTQTKFNTLEMWRKTNWFFTLLPEIGTQKFC